MHSIRQNLFRTYCSKMEICNVSKWDHWIFCQATRLTLVEAATGSLTGPMKICGSDNPEVQRNTPTPVSSGYARCDHDADRTDRAESPCDRAVYPCTDVIIMHRRGQWISVKTQEFWSGSSCRLNSTFRASSISLYQSHHLPAIWGGRGALR